MDQLSTASAGGFKIAPSNDQIASDTHLAEMETPGASRASTEQVTEISEPIIGGDENERKSIATLAAQFALKGYSFQGLSDGSFLVHRWNLIRPLPDLLAARRFYRAIGGTT
jgi:hypothetical protein